MRKVFGMIALLLALAACNKAETDIPTEKPEARTTGKADGITITATLAPKSFGTKAVSEGTNTIVSTWAQNEKIAVLYKVNEKEYAAEANVNAVDGKTGSATISFTVASGTADNTPCTLVYPASAAKDDHTGVKDAATLLAAQDGTLNASLDVRVGAGTIQTTTPSLTVTTQPAPQFAIFKFTTKNADGSATIDVRPLTIIIGAQNFVITPASATSTLYAALPAISSQTVSFSAIGSDSRTHEAAYPGISFAAGNFYQSVLKMTGHATSHTLYDSVVGDVVGTDGLAYAVADKGDLPQGVTVAGMVAYKSGKTGLVIALTDEASHMAWSAAMGASGAAAHTPAVTSHTWELPSREEWELMFEAFGGEKYNGTGLNTAIGNAGGTAFPKWEKWYWTSTSDIPNNNATMLQLRDNNYVHFTTQGLSIDPGTIYVRACFAFDPDLISGVFSVSDNQRVQFARGNLTYISKSYTSEGWALADNSWEYSNTYYGTTAGSHHFTWNEVFTTDNQEKIKTDLGSNSWRALSRDEWRYLLGYKGTSVRTVSWHRYAKIKGAEPGIEDKRYLLIFPDFFKETDWTAAMGPKPSDSAFDGKGQESIAYTESNFAAMQTAGIVILPAAGNFYNNTNSTPHWVAGGITGYYWTSTNYSYDWMAYIVYFGNTPGDAEVSDDSAWEKNGPRYFSVRLVQNK